MATVYVVFAEADRQFVEDVLLRPLPVAGFDFWVSSRAAALSPEAIELCDAILVVVSGAAAREPGTREQALAAVASGRPLATVRLDETPPAAVAPGLEMRLAVVAPKGEVVERRDWLRRTLPGVLPAIRPAELPAGLEGVARPLEWSEELFSTALKEVVDRHDSTGTAALIEVFVRHASRRSHPYAEPHARTDLDILRKKRQFKAMLAYAEAALASGPDDLHVRRQYGQALIEEGRFEEALAVLSAVAREKDRSLKEAFEARGLIGRLYKQQYVDAPARARQPELLERAIEAYRSVYDEDHQRVWQGVNAASLILRACDDGIDPAQRPRGQAIARSILETLRERERDLEDGLDVWECATRVEALLALDHAGASEALDQYLQHPAMDAFEASSTHRQFDQVLRLGEKPERSLLDRLWQAVERTRGLGMSRRLAEPPLPKAFGGRGAVPILIRVSDPEWRPREMEVTIQGRLGVIVSAEASPEAVAALLRDPAVISIEESRPAESLECHRSVPFIGVTDPYQFAGESFRERGKHALVAIIDDDIDVAHTAFLGEDGKSRIVGIWDQRDDCGPPPDGFTLGTFHDADAIRTYTSPDKVPPALKRLSHGHGTHVASIAAGRAVGQFGGGVAPEAAILVVIARSSEPIGYSKTHVDALLFIEKKAAELGRPVVVNVSQGMNAGAHDGNSQLEAAFDAFLRSGREPGRAIVKSAGNERGKNGHARFSMPSRAREDLTWVRDAGATSRTERIELWWKSANELECQLVAPSGAQSNWVGPSLREEKGTLGLDGDFHLKFEKLHRDNGDSQLLIELEGKIAPGPWRLRIQSRAIRTNARIDAWIERSGLSPSAFTSHISEEMTLSIPGTANSVITVGAVELSDPVMTGTFSSYGPTRDNREKPDVAAPGVGIAAADGGTADGVWVKDGTSMAAPHVAGAIALVFSRAVELKQDLPAANQIVAALRDKTLNNDRGIVQWTEGQGYGVLDVAALLATKF